MFCLLKLPKDLNANWERDFYDNIKKGMSELGVQVVEVSKSDLGMLTKKDYVFVINFQDFASKEVSQTKAKIIGHSNGTAINPYAYNVNREHEKKDLHETIDINTMNLPSQEKIMRLAYPEMNKSLTIGFPLDFDKYKQYQGVKKRKKIVIGGRITPDKQFYLSAFLLQDLVKKYEIVFTVIDKKYEWTKFYDLSRFADMGFKFVECPTSERFYKELSDADIYFTASLGDTFSVGIVEASLLGCYVVAPKIKDGFPLWSEYYDGGYMPFDKQDVEGIVKLKPDYNIDLKWFDYKKVCQRLKKGLSL